MIKVYKSLQHYIANKKNYFTIPDVINLSYKKHALQLWEAEVKIYSNNIAVKFIDEWSWMDLYDNDNNYIGLFRVKKIYKSYHKGARATVYKLVHAFSTMLDDAFLVSETGLTAEFEFDSLNSLALMQFMFSRQTTKHWKLIPVKYSGDNSGVQFTRQNGLLKYVYEALEEMGGKYSMIFNTTEYPWKAVIVEAKEKVDCRVREEYNLLSYSMDQDYAPYYNRLYVYGEKDILGAPIEDRRQPIKEPEITSKMSQKQIDAAWKRYNEAVKKRKEEDTKRIADDKAAWEKYKKDYKAWSQKQIAMQNTRDAALEKRRAEIAAGTRPSGGYFANLPPRPSTVPPPEKPNLHTRETDTMAMSIGELNEGKPYIEDVEEVASRGVVSRVVEFRDIKDPKLLMDTAQRIFDDRQARTIDLQLTAIELNKILEEKIPFDDFHLGQHLLMQTKDDGNFDLVIVGEGKNNVYGNPYDIQLEIVEVGGPAGTASKPHVVSPTDMMLKKLQELQKDILYARKSANGKNTIYTGEVEPLDPEINDIWYKTVIDPVTGEKTVEMYIWNGVIWVNPFESLNRLKEAIEANQKEIDAFDAENAAYISKIEDKIKSMTEELSNIDNKIQEGIAKDLADLDTKLKSIEGNINNEVATKIADINKTIEDVKKTFGKALSDQEAGILQKVTQQVDQELLTIKDTIAQQKKDVEGLTTKVTDVTKGLDGLSARVAAVEESDTAQNERLASIDVRVDGITASVSDVKKTQEGVSTKLNTIEQTANSTKSLLTKEVKDRQAAIKETNERISTTSSEVSRLSQTVTDNNQNATKRLNEITSDLASTKQTISEVKDSQDQTNAKIVTFETSLNGISTKVTDVEKKAGKNADDIKTNMTAISQTKNSISTIISTYAKKTDLNGLATTESVKTMVEAKAGEITTSLSSQITTIDSEMKKIKNRPTYTIGTDGYWYKDGVKTSTKATGTDGGEFGWNLLLKGDTKVTNNKNYMVRSYNLAEDIPEGTVVSLVIRFKGKRTPNLIKPYNSGGTYAALNQIRLDDTSDAAFRTYVVTDKWRGLKSGNTSLYVYVGAYSQPSYAPVSIEWVKLVYGDKPTMEFAPAKSEIYGKDGKDANLYTGETAPKDTNRLWYQPSTKTTFIYYGGKWIDINTSIVTQLNTVKDTVSSHTRTISENRQSIDTMDKSMSASLAMMSNKYSELEQSVEGLKLRVSDGNLLTSINVAAGKIIFGVSDSGKKATLMITPETVYIEDATIKSSQIESLSASKITAGTIDAQYIRVINLDASAISTGRISGTRGFWDLDIGLFQNGYTLEDRPSWMQGLSYTSVQMEDGVFTFRKSGNKYITLDSKGLQFWGSSAKAFEGKELSSITSEADKLVEEFGRFTARWWSDDTLVDTFGNPNELAQLLGVKNLSMSHMAESTMTISYLNASKSTYNPYIVFDNYSKLPFTKRPIYVAKDTEFKRDIYLANDMIIKPVRFNTFDTSNYASAIFLGVDRSFGLVLSAKGIWWCQNEKPWNGSGASRDERKASMWRVPTGDRTWQGGAWEIINDYSNNGTK